jgi:hypothetical protein
MELSKLERPIDSEMLIYGMRQVAGAMIPPRNWPSIGSTYVDLLQSELRQGKEGVRWYYNAFVHNRECTSAISQSREASCYPVMLHSVFRASKQTDVKHSG